VDSGDKPNVTSNDFLGRSVSDQRYAKYASNQGRIHFRSIRPTSNSQTISVDKLCTDEHTGQCTYDVAHVSIAESRSGTFYGWGYFTRRAIETATNCIVIPDAIEENPNHVQIMLPETIFVDSSLKNEISEELAKVSRWLQYRDPFAETV